MSMVHTFRATAQLAQDDGLIEVSFEADQVLEFPQGDRPGTSKHTNLGTLTFNSLAQWESFKGCIRDSNGRMSVVQV